MLNKKGTFVDDLPGIIATIVFIVIIVFLFAGYQKYRENTKYQAINMIKRNIEADELLLNYLQKSTTFDINNDGVKEKVTFADLIIFSFLKDEKDTYAYLEEETKKILMDHKKSDKSGWNIRMYLGSDKKITVNTFAKYISATSLKDFSSKSAVQLSVSSTFLPLNKGDKSIKIELEEVVEG